MFDKAMKRVNTFVDFRTELLKESTKKAQAEIAQKESSKRAGDELEQERSKKQKVDEDKETAKLQQLVNIISDEEGEAIDAIPLAIKPPSIVDWKVVKEENKSYYQIIKAYGSLKIYIVFSHILKDFDREDIDADYELAQRLQAEEQQELNDKEKATLFMQLLEKRRKFFAAKRAEEKRNRPPTKDQQRSVMCT
nr:hypothetical protein [Tanacetum cinerariifolium]